MEEDYTLLEASSCPTTPPPPIQKLSQMAKPDWLTFLCPQAEAIRGPARAPATAARYHTGAQWQATFLQCHSRQSRLHSWLPDLLRLRWLLQAETKPLRYWAQLLKLSPRSSPASAMSLWGLILLYLEMWAHSSPVCQVPPGPIQGGVAGNPASAAVFRPPTPHP